jgi:YD repeat-containing protein
MWIDTAKDALRQGRALELRYDGYSRFVEVHALGYNRDGHALMRCWQVSGGGVKSERVGWKLMRLDRGFDAYVQARRPEHAPHHRRTLSHRACTRRPDGRVGGEPNG